MLWGKNTQSSNKNPTPTLDHYIFESICVLWENSIHMFLSLLYVEMFLGEYLTSRKFRPFPPLSSLCLMHHPFFPNTLKPGICVGSTKQPGQYHDYNLTVLNGFEPSTRPKSTLRPVPSQLHVAGQKGWKLLSVPGSPTPGGLLSDSLQVSLLRTQGGVSQWDPIETHTVLETGDWAQGSPNCSQ